MKFQTFSKHSSGLLLAVIFFSVVYAKLCWLFLDYVTFDDFSLTLQVLTTCAKDGSIKVWDESWNLKSVFIGHTSAVNSLSAYQKSPLVVSVSDDGTMRLWNVDTSEEVDCIETGQSITGMCRKFGETSFFSFTDHSLTFWKINTVYTIFTVVG